MDRNIIEEMLISAEEQLKYKNSSYCKGQIVAYRKVLEMISNDMISIVNESKRY